MNTNRSALPNSRILPSFSGSTKKKKKKKVSHSSTSVSARAFGIQTAPVADLQTLQNTSLAHGAWSLRWRRSPDGALNFRTDMLFSYWPAFLTAGGTPPSTDTCSAGLSFLVCKRSFRPRLDRQQRLFKQTEATPCLLFSVNSVYLYYGTLASIRGCGSKIKLQASDVYACKQGDVTGLLFWEDNQQGSRIASLVTQELMMLCHVSFIPQQFKSNSIFVYKKKKRTTDVGMWDRAKKLC